VNLVRDQVVNAVQALCTKLKIRREYCPTQLVLAPLGAWLDRALACNKLGPMLKKGSRCPGGKAGCATGPDIGKRIATHLRK
jgi:hypothetical protein